MVAVKDKKSPKNTKKKADLAGKKLTKIGAWALHHNITELYNKVIDIFDKGHGFLPKMPDQKVEIQQLFEHINLELRNQLKESNTATHNSTSGVKRLTL